MSEDAGTNEEESTPQKIDETISGGRYQDNQGHWVNAQGQRINEDGSIDESAPQPVKPKSEQ